jgi:hypothetical protein
MKLSAVAAVLAAMSTSPRGRRFPILARSSGWAKDIWRVLPSPDFAWRLEWAPGAGQGQAADLTLSRACLELLRAEITESGVQSALIVNLVDESEPPLEAHSGALHRTRRCVTSAIARVPLVSRRAFQLERDCNHLRTASIRREATGARSPARASGAGRTAQTLGFNLKPWRDLRPTHKDGPSKLSVPVPGPLLQGTRSAALLPFF